MIYVTGDTHGDFSRFSKKNFGKILNDGDYVIICGDFGLLWYKDKELEYFCRIFSQKKYTILFIDGNHEKFSALEEYPIEEWNGGKARHIVRDKVIHLMRGQVFEIDGKTFFTFGGAQSTDFPGGLLDRNDPLFHEKKKQNIRLGLDFKILYESWWPQELPSQEELDEGLENLKKHGDKVDYIISHCASSSTQDVMDSKRPKNILTDYFDNIEKMEYKKWFFGHYHDDKVVDEKHILVNKKLLSI